MRKGSRVLAERRGRKGHRGRRESPAISVCLARAGLRGHLVLPAHQATLAHLALQGHRARAGLRGLLVGHMDNREKSQIERDVYVSLRDHFTALLAERDKRLDERFAEQEKRWAAALGAQRSNVYILIIAAFAVGLLALAIVGIWFGAEAH